MKYIKSQYIKIVFGELKKQKTYIFFIVVFILLTSVIPMLEVRFLQVVTEDIQGNAITHRTIGLFIAYIFFRLLLPGLVSGIQSLVNKIADFHVGKVVSNTVYKKIKSLPIPLLENGKEMNLIHRMFRISSATGTSIFSLLIELSIQAVTSLLLVISFNWLGLFLCILSLIVNLLTFKKNNQVNEREYELDRSHEEAKRRTHAFKDLLMNKKSCLELFSYDTRECYTEKMYDQTEALNIDVFREKVKIERTNIIIVLFKGIFLAFLYFVVIIFMIGNIITVPVAVSAVTIGVGSILGAVDQCVYLVSALKNHRHYILEFEELMDLPEIHKDVSLLSDSDMKNIQFRHVFYQYKNNDATVLKDIHFEIKAGEKIAIVGDNGAGKSTLIRLLLGIDQPSDGNMLLNDSDVYPVHDIWTITSVMLQNFYKYSYSVKENIIISCLQNSKNETILKEILNWSQAECFIQELPKGLETILIQDGALSGGEWQRIALSRAKYKQAELYVLDEPNAAVDPKYEIELMKRLFNLIEDKTAIIISHRLPICQLCDKVLVLKNGEIAEFGSHNELLKNKSGLYYEMYKKQAELYV